MTEEEKFIENLYNEANEQLKDVYKEQKNSRDDILKEIAMIMLAYSVIDGFMKMNKDSKDKSYKKLSNLIISRYKSISKSEIKNINTILESTIKKTFDFYSYNADLKDVKNIIDNNFKGKHFSKRVWANEEAVAKRLHLQVKEFINGNINVNQIKKDIEKTFNANAYNSKRLVETEVNRCQGEAFDRFCREVGVKRVRYNAKLDSRLCNDCAQYHDKVYNFEEKIERPRHPLCRCFYTIEDYNYKKNISKYENDGIINNKKWLYANFSNQKRFEDHLKHLVEYDNITREEYLNIARELLAADLSEDVEGFISVQGWLFKYRKSTNDFAMGHPKGTISTLFKPKEKYDYYLGEKEKYK